MPRRDFGREFETNQGEWLLLTSFPVSRLNNLAFFLVFGLFSRRSDTYDRRRSRLPLLPGVEYGPEAIDRTSLGRRAVGPRGSTVGILLPLGNSLPILANLFKLDTTRGTSGICVV